MATSGVVVSRSVTTTETVVYDTGVTYATSVTVPSNPPPPPGPPTPPPGTIFYAPFWESTEYADTVGAAPATTNGTIAIAVSAEFPDGAYVSDGSNGNYVSYAVVNNAGQFNFPGDFLVKFSAAKTANTATGYDTALAFGNGSGIPGFVIELSSIRGLAIVYNYSAIINYSFDPNDGVVRVYEWGRVGTNMFLKIDGVEVASTVNSAEIKNVAPTLIVGALNDYNLGVSSFNGQLQLVSISKT